MISVSMVGSTVQTYYKKVSLKDCTRFVYAELSFGADLC